MNEPTQPSYFTEATCGGHIVCDPKRCVPYYVHHCIRIDPCDGTCETSKREPWPLSQGDKE